MPMIWDCLISKLINWADLRIDLPRETLALYLLSNIEDS